MSELAANLQSEQIGTSLLFVAGAGTNALRSTHLFRLMAAQADKHDLPYDVVDGLYDAPQPTLSPASLQETQLIQKIDQLPAEQRVVIVAHSLGAVAGLSTVERYSGQRPVRMAAVAPPLPTPNETVYHAKLADKRNDEHTIMQVFDLRPGYDHADRIMYDAAVPRDFLDEIDAISDGFQTRLLTAVHAGSVALISPGHDWNRGSLRIIESWRQDTTDPGVQDRLVVIEGAAHSLNPTDPELSAVDKLTQHTANSRYALEVGLALVA